MSGKAMAAAVAALIAFWAVLAYATHWGTQPGSFEAFLVAATCALGVNLGINLTF